MVVAQTPAHLEAVQQASLYYSTSLIAILFWDYLNTLPLEIGLVWKPLFSKNQREQFSESSWEKRIFLILSPLLFFILRYVCLVEFAAFLWSQHTRIPASTCDHWQHFFPVASALVALSANAIMAFRVTALWGSDIWIKWSLMLLLIPTSAITLWASTFTMGSGPGCTPVPTSKNLNAFYLCVTIFDFILVVLTIIRATMVYKKQRGYTGQVFKIAIRDGILYFIIVMTANLSAIAFELQNHDAALKDINASLATIFTSIFCAKIYFNLRKQVHSHPHMPFGGCLGQDDSTKSSTSRSSPSDSLPTVHQLSSSGMGRDLGIMTSSDINPSYAKDTKQVDSDLSSQKTVISLSEFNKESPSSSLRPMEWLRDDPNRQDQYNFSQSVYNAGQFNDESSNRPHDMA